VWPENLSGLPVLRLDELNRARDWNALLEETVQHQAKYGPHPWVQWFGTAALQNLKRHGEAAEQLEELLLKVESPEARLLLACDLARQRLMEGRLDQTGPFFDLLVSSGVSDELKAECLDSLATLSVYDAPMGQHGMFLAWAQEAVRLCPDRLTLKGTLGSALCENDRWDEAEPLLREVLDRSPALQDQGISAAYLARLCHRRGDLLGAKDWLAYSRYVFPSPELDSRLRLELPGHYEKSADGSLRRPAT
jgi:tetratricopeptide (TPR) repeat protein